VGLSAAALARAAAASAQTPPPGKEATAVRVPSGSIHVDGRLDEQAWSEATPISDFVQKEPAEGVPPSERTEIRFLYDDGGLYVGARMSSRDGRDGIQAPLQRRDNPYSPSQGSPRPGFSSRPNVAGRPELADYILISLDTFLDRRTAYSFGVTASGVRIDHQHLTDSESDIDDRYDPVWQAETSIDDEGWTAEMWIPFEQLRFNEGGDMTWGLQVQRWIPLKNEDDYWILIPRTVDAWSSRFGLLHGIGSIEQGRRLEMLPYVSVGSTLTANRDVRNPFVGAVNMQENVGGDLKMGLGSNLTLDATFFPDFGQVEVDPAVINLTDTETFYPERRPFFTEGSSLFESFETNYYYSRRIGGPPLASASGDFVDIPKETTILGAAKLTGRLPSGTSLGILGAVTDRESARVFDFDSATAVTGTTTDVPVTPRTEWSMVRVQQEVGRAGSTLALMMSGVHREMGTSDPLASLLSRNAWMAGGDALWRIAGGAYEVTLSGGFTGIDGTQAAMVRAQRNSVHYFQRPDADYVRVDSSRTSLSGGKLTLTARRVNGRHWLWNVFMDMESPEVEFNDIGRIGTADGLQTRQSLTYRETTPGQYLRSYSFALNHTSEWNFGGDRENTQLSASTNVTLNNFWGARASVNYSPRTQNERLTRGGPSMASPEDWSVSLSLQSNSSAETRWSVGASYGRDEVGGWRRSANASISLIPAPRWQISLSPSYQRQVDSRQYVTTLGGGSAATYGGRYVFAFTDRTTLALETRLNFTLKPDLNLEIYAQPFAASARYFDWGELAQARGLDLRTYGTDGTTIAPQADGRLDVTDGADAFTIANKDFNLRSFRSTAVVSWEWRPGSTLFIVWQQSRARQLDLGTQSNAGDLFGSVTTPGDNFFAIKVSYWLGL
jgi:Domain of unknown function (DUF5916)